ncbi:protein FAM162A [Calliopsis andreniformis]|uniref:protein FAM162A n=1 Tax=Calliopsis andreniformis TaxID=337506 RepID=UPI003FCD1F9E
MLGARLIRQLRLPRTRQLNCTSIKGNKSESNEPLPKPSNPLPTTKSEESAEASAIGAPVRHVTNFDRRLLVWVKRYPSMDQVPDRVTLECMQKAHTRARIKVCNMMIVFAIIGFILSSMQGKREIASGRNILIDRLKHMEKLQEQGKIEAAAAAEAAKKS